MIRHILAASSVAVLVACQPASDNSSAVTPQADPVTQETAVDLPMPLPVDTAADINADDLRQRIRILADDAFEGRGPAAEKGELTADWMFQIQDRVLQRMQ